MSLLNVFINFLGKILDFKIYNISIFNYLMFITIISIIYLVFKYIGKDK